MNQILPTATTAADARYARCIAASKRVRWDIDTDVFQGRVFDRAQKYLPDGISKADAFPGLSAEEMRYLSQIQGRTYANMFGLVERFINAKVLELSRDHWFGDQVKLEAMVRFSDEELKHQEMFRRIEALIAAAMPDGYEFLPRPNEVADVVLGKSTWAVLGLTLMIELFTQAHYRESIAEDADLSPLYKDVFRFHWLEESQHAILDELEWRREDGRLTADQRDAAVDDLIALAGAVDGILQAQASSDAGYFARTNGRKLAEDEAAAVNDGILKAYRWQYIFSGATHPHFAKVLGELTSGDQMRRIGAALESLA